MVKHLKYKHQWAEKIIKMQTNYFQHQWAEKIIKMQTNYFHVMFDTVAKIKIYDLHTFFDRIKNHLAHKRFQRGT